MSTAPVASSWVFELTHCELDSEVVVLRSSGDEGSKEAKTGNGGADEFYGKKAIWPFSLSKSLASDCSGAGAAESPEVDDDAGERQPEHLKLVWCVLSSEMSRSHGGQRTFLSSPGFHPIL